MDMYLLHIYLLMIHFCHNQFRKIKEYNHTTNLARTKTNKEIAKSLVDQLPNLKHIDII